MLYIFLAIFGLVFGSFLNVCIFRLTHDESIVIPRSHCPECQHPIRWYDNIPLASYVVLGGRCRDCHTRISPVYPVVEALTGLMLPATFHRHGLSPEFVKYAVFVMMLIILIFTDLLERRIPHPVTLFGIGVGFLFCFFIPVDSRPLDWLLSRMDWFIGGVASSLLGTVAGALVGGGLFYIVGEAFYHFGGKDKEYLGFGDVMLMLMVGCFLGPPLTVLTILLGSLGGTIIALAFTIVNPQFRNYPWPYGTFLGVAAIYASLDGTRLLDAYLRWSGLAR
jgi:leader peptidase (prepilin peptidase) / N-methyltransferase